MMCNDARKLLPDLALGDLDAEPAAEVSAHVGSCAACRSEEAALRRTLGALRGSAPLAPSTERRSAAAAAMARAHAEQSEKLLIRRPTPRLPVATAAAFLLVLAAALTLRGGGATFTVTHISGGAKILDRENGFWHPVLGGMRISVGDRLVTDSNCRVRLVSGATELILDEETSVDVVANRRITLDGGRLLAVAPPSELLVITDMANNSAKVTGRVELRLRDAKASFGGTLEVKGKAPEVPEVQVEVKRRLVASVLAGEAALGGAKDQVLRASAGQEGTFTFGNQPATAPLVETTAGDWARSLFNR